MRRAREARVGWGAGRACVAGLAKRGPATRRVALLAVLSLGGCSFIGVKGPGALPDPPPPADSIHCTTSDVLPTIDALAGAGALAAATAGIFAEETGSHGAFDHWELYAVTPLVAVAVAYFVSSSHGTREVERCAVAKDPTLPPVQ